MTLLFIYFALAIGVSFLCSILEAVLLSLTPTFISATKEKSAHAGLLLEGLKSNIDRPLAAILSLNTIAHTIGAAGVGAQSQRVWDNVPLSIISAVLTLLILVFSEIIPKTLGANYWRVLAVPAAHTTRVMTLLMWPLVVLSQGLSHWLSPKHESTHVSRDELAAMASLGEAEGILDKLDAKALQSVIRFQSVHVRDILTPRIVAHTLDPDHSLREVVAEVENLNYSRYPVIEEDEHIIGYVMKNDLLKAAANDEWDIPLRDLVRPVLIVPETISVKRLYVLFLRKREHLAVAVDEFGSFAGVVTLEDVLETLIGHEIMDEVDEVEDLRDYARKTSRHKAGEDAGN